VALLLGQFRLCRGWPQYIRGAEAGSDWVSGLILLKDAFVVSSQVAVALGQRQ